MKAFSAKWYKEQCDNLRIYPERVRGQNFLTDTSVVERMVDMSNIKKGDTVLEIGPGFGVLTEELLKTGAHVIAVEKEKKFESFLNEEVMLHIEDILDFDETELPKSYKIVSNLPYSISSSVLEKFLTSKNPPSLMTLMLQKEVVGRLVAKPGDMTRISVLTQFFSNPKKLFNVSKSKFWPKPKVDSAVVMIELIDVRGDVNEDKFFKLVKKGFSSKRKKLANNIKSIIKNPKEILEKIGLSKNIRAQELSVKDWISLFNKIF